MCRSKLIWTTLCGMLAATTGCAQQAPSAVPPTPSAQPLGQQGLPRNLTADKLVTVPGDRVAAEAGYTAQQRGRGGRVRGGGGLRGGSFRGRGFTGRGFRRFTERRFFSNFAFLYSYPYYYPYYYDGAYYNPYGYYPYVYEGGTYAPAYGQPYGAGQEMASPSAPPQSY